MTEPARTAAALRGRQADSARRRDRVIKAIGAAAAAGQGISASSIARAAGVDRTFLYRHRDLIEQLHAAQTQVPSTAGTGPAASRASLQADLLNAQQRAARLAVRVQQLERHLSDVLGEHIWRESGLGAPADVDTLKQRNLTLEQHIAGLRLQLKSAIRTSLPPAPPTASSWPSSTRQHATSDPAPTCTTPVALTARPPQQPDLGKQAGHALCPFCTPRE